MCSNVFLTIYQRDEAPRIIKISIANSQQPLKQEPTTAGPCVSRQMATAPAQYLKPTVSRVRALIRAALVKSFVSFPDRRAIVRDEDIGSMHDVATILYLCCAADKRSRQSIISSHLYVT